ncbi:hypothetical protein [Maribacter sp. 1_MG-2023]|uniref:hypothetical protein n=1 Tax=Maribacter sp. 1_MG-2023 TaxID=3062677 RepID=UPI0026E28597|nr:hypothetical protein [Maribacter sp. 1_MG-2023]MDO6470537.1 hypothetical protein [Maribacter sp. 1_MG-2023]
MKKVKIILIAMLAFGIGTVTAHDTESKDDKGTKWITAQIHDMLADEDIPDQIRGAKAKIKIAFAEDGMYRLLSIKSTNSQLKEFLKNGIDFKNLEPGNTDLVYVIPIEIAD